MQECEKQSKIYRRLAASDLRSKRSTGGPFGLPSNQRYSSESVLRDLLSSMKVRKVSVVMRAM